MTMSIVSNSSKLPLMLQWLDLESICKTLNRSVLSKHVLKKNQRHLWLISKAPGWSYTNSESMFLFLCSSQLCRFPAPPSGYLGILSLGSGCKSKVEHLPYVDVAV